MIVPLLRRITLGFVAFFAVRTIWEVIHLLGYAPEVWAADALLISPTLTVWGSATVVALLVFLSLPLVAPINFNADRNVRPITKQRMLIAYRRSKGSDVWHWCTNCQHWPTSDYVELMTDGRPTSGELDHQCLARERAGNCKHR